jgi:hypothetical protein
MICLICVAFSGWRWLQKGISEGNCSELIQSFTLYSEQKREKGKNSDRINFIAIDFRKGIRSSQSKMRLKKKPTIFSVGSAAFFPAEIGRMFLKGRVHNP